MTQFVCRRSYLSLLSQYKGTSSIKVLSGVRRCGKSTLLDIFADELIGDGFPNNNVFKLKCDSPDVPLNVDSQWLEDRLKSFLASANNNHRTVFLLDEIQEIPEWEKVLRRFHTTGKVDIYITGSNAFLLSSDLATHLSGRYIQIPVYPLSFREYLDFSNELLNVTPNTYSAFDSYLRFGGMPGLFSLRSQTQDLIERELQAISDTVILNDVAKRFEVRDLELLERLVRHLFSTSGNLFSTRNIVGALVSNGRKVYAETIESYINGLCKAFLLYPCEQSGIQGKEVLRPLRKFYAPDTGLRNLQIGFTRRDIGYQLESVVRLELARRGYSVAIGALKNGEINFVAERADKRLYIQVAQSILDENVAKRELGPLRMLTDAYPRIVLTTDQIGTGTTEEGIIIVNIIDWLLKD